MREVCFEKHSRVKVVLVNVWTVEKKNGHGGVLAPGGTGRHDCCDSPQSKPTLFSVWVPAVASLSSLFFKKLGEQAPHQRELPLLPFVIVISSFKNRFLLTYTKCTCVYDNQIRITVLFVTKCTYHCPTLETFRVFSANHFKNNDCCQLLLFFGAVVQLCSVRVNLPHSVSPFTPSNYHILLLTTL